jgi:hypothetical protein
MSNQSPFNHAIRLVTALMVLAAVMSSPLRPAPASGRPRAAYLHTHSGVPAKTSPGQHRPHTPVNSRVVQVKALSSHHELDLATDPVSLRLRSTEVVAPSTARDCSTGAVGPAVHPLRC